MNVLKPVANGSSAPADPDPAPVALSAGGGHGPSMEVAHVLFMDIVGYSKLRMNQQAAAQIELQNLVNASAEVQQAKAERKFICRPTGDGMALLFFRDLVSPVRTALQIHALMDQRAVALRAAIGAEIKLRMGIHSGTILMVEDLNAQSDAAGDGINIAQRVMDCGDADHILLSSKVAESLLGADPWQNYLTDIGEVRVKHGVKVHLYRLRGRLDGAFYGNPGMPKKVEEDQRARQAEINKYQGTFWDRHPGAKKQFAALAILAAVAGLIGWQWTTNPKFKQAIQSAYAKTIAAGRRSALAAASAKNAKNGGGSGKTSGSSASASHAGASGRHHEDASTSAAPYTDVSSGAHKVLVPELVGRTFDDAVSAGSDSGLKVVKSDKSSFNTTYGEGIVYQQSPAAGASVRDTTRLYVRVSKGDPPDADAAAAAAAASKEPDGGGATDQ